MQYDWIDFYTEFATKLLHFKTDRKTLIQKIYAVYDATGISVPKLESGDEIIDIDPFTIFGTFNKGITNANRIAILNGIASEFEISAMVPSNFDGIPVLNNLKATFYGFKDDRKANDIDNLWSFAGILRWPFIGFALIHLSTWIPEIDGLYLMLRICQANLL